MHPRSLTARVSRLISYLYIPSGRELVSMIKKAVGGRRKFRAEYLTLYESELCLESGRPRAWRRDGRGGQTRKKTTKKSRERARGAPKEAEPRRDVVHGYSAGDSFSRLCEFKGSSLKTGPPAGAEVRSLEISARGGSRQSRRDTRLYNVGLIVSR